MSGDLSVEDDVFEISARVAAERLRVGNGD